MSGFNCSRIVQHTRKEHTCAHCGTTIDVGSACMYMTGHWDSAFYAYHAHSDCVEMWNTLFQVYGDLQDGMALDLLEVLDYPTPVALAEDWADNFPMPVLRLSTRRKVDEEENTL